MKKIKAGIIMFMLFLLISGVVYAGKPTPVLKEVLAPQYWKAQAINDLIPFWIKTQDKDNGGFYTDVDEDGAILPSSNKYPRMISRVIFGFCAAYLLSGDDKYLEYAKYGMDFMSQYGWDKENGGWFTYVDEEGTPDSWDKNLFDETYCNLGPVLYYFTTNDKEAVSLVKKTHALMQSKAWDKTYGGYYASVGKKWNIVTSSKSFNSEIDTCTAYLIYYYLATKDPAVFNDLKAIGEAVAAHMVDPKTGFVGEKFTAEWDWVENQLQVGHNLKTGWVMTRMYMLTKDRKYLETAEKIAKAQVKYTWDRKYYGWLFTFDRTYPDDVDDTKDWWTQEEGNNLMLCLYRIKGNRDYLDKFQKSASFWDRYFIDRKNGECYSTLTRDGTPTTRKKAHSYKSAYHTMEQALLSYLYLSLYVEKKDATLYFSLSSDSAGEKHYVNLLEDPAVIIKSVEIDGQPYADFQPAEGCVTLPQGKNMKVKVVFGIK